MAAQLQSLCQTSTRNLKNRYLHFKFVIVCATPESNKIEGVVTFLVILVL